MIKQSETQEVLVRLGERIASVRRALGLSQTQLAELAGTSYRPIYLIESGKSIHAETLAKLCVALGLRISLEPAGMQPDV
ncbi:MAG TPA: helix-turn-helix transcriptional regulator [Fimbriimonadaceae bacterium]|nr:helix-turn-helix transcriptional regulator [Fimbriimonadaceae bacterium]